MATWMTAIQGLQTKISREKLSQKIGRTFRVLVDEINEDCAIGRAASDSPEVDGIVQIEGDHNASPGDFIEVKITGSDEHDLAGRKA